MPSLSEIAKRRAALLGELEGVDVELRAAVREAVASGRSVVEVSREAGVTRPTVYKWAREASPDTDRLQELDARYERLVDLLVEAHKPAGGLSRRGNYRSGLQMEQSARNVARKRGSAAKALRESCESLLLRLDGEAVDLDLIRQCAQEAGFNTIPGGDLLSVIMDELAEAYTLRKRVEARTDPFHDV